jgi:hypothetical protein
MKTLSLLLFGFLLLAGFLFSPPVRAENDHLLVRRIAAFPVQAPAAFSAGAERAWWKIREELTSNRRFLIASKQFMIRKEVFQPRGEMEEADAVILGKLLDANAMIVTYLKDRQLTMIAYSGVNGMTLWRNSVALHPSLPVGEQLEPSALKLVRDFIASIPYQGFLIVDPLIGKAIYDQGSSTLAKIEVGTDAQVQKGDPVQFVRITGMGPLFQEGGQMTVIAEGTVVQVESDIVTVEVKRVSDMQLLKEKTAVRLPKEAQRLQESYAFKDKFRRQLGPEMLSADLSPPETESQQHKPLLTTLSAIGSFALMILLAF